MAYLDNSGLAHFWQSIKTILNNKQNKIITTNVTISVSDWSNNQCTKNVSNVTANNTVIVTYEPNSKIVYSNADIYCSAQGTGTLTFSCETTPTSSVTVNIMIIN